MSFTHTKYIPRNRPGRWVRFLAPGPWACRAVDDRTPSAPSAHRQRSTRSGNVGSRREVGRPARQSPLGKCSSSLAASRSARRRAASRSHSANCQSSSATSSHSACELRQLALERCKRRRTRRALAPGSIISGFHAKTQLRTQDAQAQTVEKQQRRTEVNAAAGSPGRRMR